MGKGLIPAAADTVVKIIMHDGCDGTGYSIDDLVAEDADDAGGSYNRGGGVAA